MIYGNLNQNYSPINEITKILFFLNTSKCILFRCLLLISGENEGIGKGEIYLYIFTCSSFTSSLCCVHILVN